MAKLDRDFEIGYARETSKILPILAETFRELGFADNFRTLTNRKNVTFFRDNELSVVSNLRYDQIYSEHNNDNPIASNAYCIFPEHNFGTGLAFVRTGLIHSVLVSALHEFGHLLGKPLDEFSNEEAKAYAFSRAGANIIASGNIEGLGRRVLEAVNIRPSEKEYPDHHMAHGFVANLVEQGMNPMELYEMLCKKSICVSDSF
ncbi:MAG: hypothetical protein AABW82_01370 [Nanoarchaeota archaeon]